MKNVKNATGKYKNVDTGAERYFAFPYRRRFSGKGDEKFMLVFDRGLDYLNELNLSGVDNKVLRKLMTNMEYENWVPINQHKIAEELGLKQQNVARSIKKLVGYGVLRKQADPSDRRKNLYQFNEEIGWRGGKGDWTEARSISQKDDKFASLKIRAMQNRLIEKFGKNGITDEATLGIFENLVVQAILSSLEKENEDTNNDEIQLLETEIEGQMPIGQFNDGDQIELSLPPVELEKDGKRYKFKGGVFTVKFKQYIGEDLD